MKDITLPIYNSEGKEVDSITLDKALFEGAVNTAAIYQTIHAYRSNQRKGLAATKTRGEVSGGGKKPWKQKGTGRARAGSTRSPLWRHGGVVFGPHPRDFSYELPKKIKKVALKSVVLAKILENNILILEGLRLETSKTKDMVKVLSNLKVNPKTTGTLVLLDAIDANLKRAMGNIEGMNANITKNTNTYEILVARKVLTTKDSFNTLMSRISALAKEKTAE